MGRMVNLCYLNISQNPFRGPISTFLEKQIEDNFPTEVFPALLVDFLKGLSSELPLDEKKEGLKIYKRRKSITFQDDFEKVNNDTGMTMTNMGTLQRI